MAARALLSSVVVLVACLAACASGLDIYVSTSGSDAGAGTQSSPFLTVARAQRALREQQPLSAPAAVHIAPGVYRLTAALEFTPEDSGSSVAPITYGVWGEGEVVLSGAAEVTGWAELARTPATYMAKVPKGIPQVNQFYANGTRAMLARSPLYQFENANGNSVQYAAGQLPGNTSDLFNLKAVRLVLYEAWTASIHPISAIDPVARNITLANPYDASWVHGASGNRYYWENAWELLTEPGQYYYDEINRLLYYVPVDGMNPNYFTTEVPILQEILSVRGRPGLGQFVQNIAFKGLTFAHTDVDYTPCFVAAGSGCNAQSAAFVNTYAAVHMFGCKNITLDSVVVAHTGGYGVWMEQATSDNVLSRSHLYDLGAGAVRLGDMQGGFQHNASLLSQGNMVHDCVLEDGGHVYQMGAGVLAQSVANTVITHNLIRNFLYTGVSIGWTWGYQPTNTFANEVSFNEIHMIGQSVLSDMGCIYTLGTQPGTVVTNNVCHDISSFDYGGWGLYTDEGSTNIVLSNNVVHHTKCSGVHQHYGMNNVFENNILALTADGNMDGSVRSSQHNGPCPTPGDQGTCSSFTFRTNIVYTALADAVSSTGPHSLNNMTFDSNVYWTTTGDETHLQFNDTTVTAWRAHGKDVHSVVADPRFVNPAEDLVHLQPDSPAFALGFVAIDTSTVGPRSSSGAQQQQQQGDGDDEQGWAVVKAAVQQMPCKRPLQLFTFV